MVLVVAGEDAAGVLKRLKTIGEKAFAMGEIVKDRSGPKVIYDPELE